jgi:hypothetical protein
MVSEYILNCAQALITAGVFVFLDQKTDILAITILRYVVCIAAVAYAYYYAFDLHREYEATLGIPPGTKIETKLWIFVFLNVFLFTLMVGMVASVIYLPTVIAPLSAS